MIEQVFRGVIFLSCIGSAFAALLAAIQPITRKHFSAAWHSCIWATVLLVMLLPVKIAFPRMNQPPFEPGTPAYLHVGGDAVSVRSADDTEPCAGTEPTGLIGAILSRIWLAGAVGLGGARLAAYWHALHMLRQHAVEIHCQTATYTRRKLHVYRRKGAGPPLLIGVVRPMVLLPQGDLTAEQLHYVLLHETTHLKRHDIWFRWLAVLVRCVHWFNPAAYLMGRQLNRTCEIACDLAVVSTMTQEEVRSYIHTILALLPKAGPDLRVPALGMASNKEEIKRRLLMIKNHKPIRKRMRRISTFVSASLLAVVLLASGTLAGALGVYETPRQTVTRFGNPISFFNAPYQDAGVLYVPLRETLGHFIDLSDGISTVSWDNGTIELHLFDKNSGRMQADGRTVYAYLYYYKLQIGDDKSYTGDQVDFALRAPIAWKDGVTYVPIDFLETVQKESGLLQGFALE